MGKPTDEEAIRLLDAYTAYVLDWSIRKNMRQMCQRCHGNGVLWHIANDKIEAFEPGTDTRGAATLTCPRCDGTRMDNAAIGQDLMLVVSELVEILQNDREGRGREPDDKCPDFTRDEIEAADVLLRVLNTAGARGWRIGGAVVAKMAYNETRPPNYNGRRY